MKHVTKLLAVMLVVFIAATLFTGCSSNENEAETTAPTVNSTTVQENVSEASSQEESTESQQSVEDLGYNSLSTDADRDLYEKLGINANKPIPGDIYISDISALSLDILDIIRIYKDDHPEVFWLDYWDRYESDGSGNSQTITPVFMEEGEDLTKKKTDLNYALISAISNAPKDGSDYEKELYIHDWLIENVAISKEENPDTSTIGAHDIYGALVNKEAVCDGFSRAFQLLCKKLGLNALTIYGQALDKDDAYGNHTWNAVELDGEWYYVDVTLDKSLDDSGSADTHQYFNVTTEVIEKDHFIFPLMTNDQTEEEAVDDQINNHTIPECTATKYKYSK